MGTFDPLHGGHIGQILRANKAMPLSKVYIFVDTKPSHKPNASSLKHRIEMAGLALDSISLPFNYSVETAENADAAGLAGRFDYRIVGIDSVISDIKDPKRWEHIKAWPMIILSIPGIPEADLTRAITTLPKDTRASMHYTYIDEATAPMMNYDFKSKSFTSERVHSTQLRAGDSASLIPAAVQEYAQRHQLYK